MPYYFFTGGLGACGADGRGGAGCGTVAGGFLMLSINCCRPAAVTGTIINIIRTKKMCFIFLIVTDLIQTVNFIGVV